MDKHAYRKDHLRIERERGKASSHPCVAPGCKNQARNWSWTRRGPQASGMNAGKPVSWGTDVLDYEPMCASHSTMRDRGGSLTHCPNGHERVAENTYISPSGGLACRACRLERSKAYREERKARMSEYTPTTQQIEHAYCDGLAGTSRTRQEAQAEFRAWLAAELRKARAEAARELADSLPGFGANSLSGQIGRWLRARADEMEGEGRVECQVCSEKPARCCPIHGLHSMPHRGCILR